MSRRTVGVLCATLALVPAAAAQRVSVTPIIGVYAPTENLYESKPGHSGGAEIYKLSTGTSYGGAVGLWFGSRVGVRVSGAVVPTSLRQEGAGDVQRTDAQLTHGSLQAVFLLASETATVIPFLNGGFGVVNRSGEAFVASSTTSSISGVFGAGTALRMGRVAVTVGAEVLDYNATYDLAGGPARQFSQRDVQLRVGLGTVFGGR